MDLGPREKQVTQRERKAQGEKRRGAGLVGGWGGFRGKNLTLRMSSKVLDRLQLFSYISSQYQNRLRGLCTKIFLQ